MSISTMTEAFRRHGAILANPQWAVSAIADDGSCVISCWTHYIKKHNDSLRLTDRLSRWKHNAAGNNLLRGHLEQIQENSLAIRLVLVRTDQKDLVDAGEDASKVKKTFAARKDVIGKLVSFDGDEFIIDFSRARI